MTDNQKKAALLALLLWWLWPRQTPGASVGWQWVDPDTGEVHNPVEPVEMPIPRTLPDSYGSIYSVPSSTVDDLWDWVQGGGGGWYGSSPWQHFMVD